MQDGIKAIRLAGAGFDILALEDGTGQAVQSSSGPVQLVAMSAMGLMFNMIASENWDKETLHNLVELTSQRYDNFRETELKVIADGEDADTARNDMVGAFNALLAQEAIELAKTEGFLDDILKPKSTLAEDLGIDKKIILQG